MDIITETGGVKQVICFDERRYHLFTELHNSLTHGVHIKRPQHDKNDDLIITDYSKTVKVQVDHTEMKQPEAADDALAQKSIFEHFLVKGVPMNSSETQYQNSSSGETLPFIKEIFNDKPGQCEIKLFRSIVDNLQENLIYAINHVYLGKLKAKKISKQAS